MAEQTQTTATTRPSRLMDLLPRPSLRAPARPAPAPAETVQPNPDPVESCMGYWVGPDPAHTPHTPCTRPAAWAGLSDHDHATPTLRCTQHRNMCQLAVDDKTMFCLTCTGRIRTMTWRKL